LGSWRSADAAKCQLPLGDKLDSEQECYAELRGRRALRRTLPRAAEILR